MEAVKSEGRRRKAAPAPADGDLRRPLAPSEKNNAAPAGRRREVASRFKSGVPPAPVATPAATASTARRCTSPSLSRASAVEGTAPPTRAQSAERRRSSVPSTPSSWLTPSNSASRSTTPVRDSAATKASSASRCATSSKAPEGLWASVRNLSPESVLPPAMKRGKFVPGSSLDQAKVHSSATAERKRSPLRGKNCGNQCENALPSETPTRRAVEQHRWPAMMIGRCSASLTSRSIAPADKVSRSISSSSVSRGHSPRRMPPSASTCNGLNQPLNETAKRLAMYGSRREDKAESSSDVSSQTSERSKSASRPSRSLSSPVPILHRSSSPNKVLSAASSTAKAFQSQSRIRPSTHGRSQGASTGQAGVTQPLFNYIFDTRKRKKNASQVENIHQLRLLYNRYLQWLFLNALSEDTLSFQKISVESILYSVWRSIVNMRDDVTMRRIDVQHLQQELKLYNILKEQTAYLEKWSALEGENNSTLVGAIEALQASTLRLPVTSGAQADAVAVKNAISSAVDVMQTLSSSICYLLLKVEDRTSMVSELSVMARKEKVTLDECRELLATAAKLQVQESSLRTHLMQLREGVA